MHRAMRNPPKHDRTREVRPDEVIHTSPGQTYPPHRYRPAEYRSNPQDVAQFADKVGAGA